MLTSFFVITSTNCLIWYSRTYRSIHANSLGVVDDYDDYISSEYEIEWNEVPATWKIWEVKVQAFLLYYKESPRSLMSILDWGGVEFLRTEWYALETSRITIALHSLEVVWSKYSPTLPGYAMRPVLTNKWYTYQRVWWNKKTERRSRKIIEVRIHVLRICISKNDIGSLYMEIKETHSRIVKESIWFLLLLSSSLGTCILTDLSFQSRSNSQNLVSVRETQSML